MSLGQTVKTETVTSSLDAERVVAGPLVPSTRLDTTIHTQALPPSFTYGQPTEGVWNRLADTDEVKVGDVVRMTYRLQVPFFQDWQTDFIVARLRLDRRFNLRAVTLNEEQRRMVVEVEILKPLSPAFLIPVIVVAVLAGALIFITTVSIEKLSTFNVGETKLKITPVIVIGALVLGFLALFPRFRQSLRVP
jgi:hypothetical protein